MSGGAWERLWERLEEDESHWAEQDRDRAGEDWAMTEVELDAMAATYWHEERDPLEGLA